MQGALMQRKNIKFLFIFIFSLVMLMNSKVYAEEFNEFDIIDPSEILLVQKPETVEDFERVLLFMAVTDTYEFYIPYSKYLINTSNLEKAVHSVSIKYPEYFGSIPIVSSWTDRAQGIVSLAIEFRSDNATNEQLIGYKKTFFNEAKKTIDDLKYNKIITDDMSDYDKAKEIYKWIASNTFYDESIAPISQTGYSVMVNKTAVCNGYTATNNLMLKMLGIKDVVGIYGDNEIEAHIWTRANLDGEIVYIDSTWGDPTPDRKGYCDFKYFAVDMEFLKKEHQRANLVWEETY